MLDSRGFPDDTESMDEKKFMLKYGYIFESREFKKLLLRQVWRIAKKDPRFKKALLEAHVPRTLPREKDYFLSTHAKKRKQLH